MELRDYLDVIRKRWGYIAAVTILAVAAAAIMSLSMTAVYVGTAQIYVSVQGGSTTGDLAQGSTYARQQVSSYARLATSEAVLGPVIDTMALDTRADRLAESITAESPAGTSLIEITASNPSPALSAAIANAVAEEFISVITELERPEDGGASSVKLTLTRQATAPESPAAPNTRLNLALSLLLGLTAGAALAVTREMLDTKVRDEGDVKRVSPASVVGAISFDEDASSRPLIVQSDPHSPRAEAFRRLRTNVQFLKIGDRPNSIIVTSSVPGEGKSTTTINLAIALADSGTRVVLVDADLRRPAVAKYMGLEGGVGLTTVLIGKATVADVVQPWGNGYLHVLPSGQIPPNPSELLGSAAMAELLKQLTDQYDVVLVDTPPLLPVTDAAVLSKLTGGALVVVGAGTVHRHQLQESLGALETVGARVLGLVLNREARKTGKSYEYYRYENESSQPAHRPSRFGFVRRGSQRAPAPAPAAGTAPVAPLTAHTTAAPTTGTGAIAGVRPGTWPGESFTEAQLRKRGEALPPQHRR